MRSVPGCKAACICRCEETSCKPRASRRACKKRKAEAVAPKRRPRARLSSLRALRSFERTSNGALALFRPRLQHPVNHRPGLAEIVGRIAQPSEPGAVDMRG